MPSHKLYIPAHAQSPLHVAKEAIRILRRLRVARGQHYGALLLEELHDGLGHARLDRLVHQLFHVARDGGLGPCPGRRIRREACTSAGVDPFPLSHVDVVAQVAQLLHISGLSLPGEYGAANMETPGGASAEKDFREKPQVETRQGREPCAFSDAVPLSKCLLKADFYIRHVQKYMNAVRLVRGVFES